MSLGELAPCVNKYTQKDENLKSALEWDNCADIIILGDKFWFHVLKLHCTAPIKCQYKTNFVTITELQIRRGNRANLGIISHI